MPSFTRALTFGTRPGLAELDGTGHDVLAGSTYLAESLTPDGTGSVLHPGFTETLTFGDPAGTIIPGYTDFRRTLEMPTAAIDTASGQTRRYAMTEQPRWLIRFEFSDMTGDELVALERFYRQVALGQSFDFTDHRSRTLTVTWESPFAVEELPMTDDAPLYRLTVELQEVPHASS